MAKPLNMTDADRAKPVFVTFSVNQFYVYHADGWLVGGSYDLDGLYELLEQNRLEWVEWDAQARTMRDSKFYRAN
jgi:hypothetical protein